MIPNGWESKKLSDIAIVTSGGTPSKKVDSYWGGDIPWVRTTEVQNCKIDECDIPEYISIDGVNNSSAKLLPKNTVLLAMIGQGKTRGQVALLKFEATCNQNSAAIILNEYQNPEFHFYHLLSQYVNIRNFSNSAGKSNLNGALVKALKVPVPPLPEQNKIAQILSTWDKAITTTEHLIANSQQQKKALMQQLLTGKKRLAGFSGEWEQVSVSQFGKVITGNTPPKADNSNYGDSVCWATAPDFKNKYIQTTGVMLSLEGSKKARVLPAGSVLVTCIASIGKNAIASVDMATNQQINSVIVSENHSNEFFFYIIGYNKQKLIAWAGTTAVPILNKSSFEKIKFLAPIKQEQQKIAQVLSSADQEIETLQQKLNFLEQEKKALMQQLLTGKRRVKITEGI